MNNKDNKYFQGKPCRKNPCHNNNNTALRYLSNNRCVECSREKSARYYLNNRQLLIERSRERRRSDPKRKSEENKQYYSNNCLEIREKSKKRYSNRVRQFQRKKDA